MSKLLLSVLILACVAGCSTTKQAAARDQAHPAAPSLKTAEQLYSEGQMGPAELALRAILKTDPGNREARYYLSLVYGSESALAARQPKPIGYYQTIPQQPAY